MNSKPQRKAAPQTNTASAPAPIASGVFAQWSGLAEANRKLPYLEPGTYLLKVTALKTGYSKRQVGVAYFVIEGDIIAATEASETPAGTTVARPITLKSTRAMQESRAIVAAIYGIDEMEVTEEDGVAATVNDGEAVVGSVIYIEATSSPWTNPKTGETINFTNCYYLPGDCENATRLFGHAHVAPF